MLVKSKYLDQINAFQGADSVLIKKRMENELENLKEILGHLKLNKQVVKIAGNQIEKISGLLDKKNSAQSHIIMKNGIGGLEAQDVGKHQLENAFIKLSEGFTEWANRLKRHHGDLKQQSTLLKEFIKMTKETMHEAEQEIEKKQRRINSMRNQKEKIMKKKFEKDLFNVCSHRDPFIQQKQRRNDFEHWFKSEMKQFESIRGYYKKVLDAHKNQNRKAIKKAIFICKKSQFEVLNDSNQSSYEDEGNSEESKGQSENCSLISYRPPSDQSEIISTIRGGGSLDLDKEEKELTSFFTTTQRKIMRDRFKTERGRARSQIEEFKGFDIPSLKKFINRRMKTQTSQFLRARHPKYSSFMQTEVRGPSLELDRFQSQENLFQDQPSLGINQNYEDRGSNENNSEQISNIDLAVCSSRCNQRYRTFDESEKMVLLQDEENEEENLNENLISYELDEYFEDSDYKSGEE